MHTNNYWNCLDLKGESTLLPFSHGIEIEYFLLDSNFHTIYDNALFTDLVREFNHIIQPQIRNSSYFTLISQYEFRDENRLRDIGPQALKKTATVSLTYKLNGNPISIDIIGKDTNIGSGGFTTLEIVTPPCQTLKELSWWLKTILASLIGALDHCNLRILPLANHHQLQGNFTGEHHHIGIQNETDRLKAYNVIRYFLPLIAVINFNSYPKENIEKLMANPVFQSFKQSTLHNLRLKQTQQIKPVPPLNAFNKNEFVAATRLSANTCRMVDLYPFTTYNTLEVRIFDTPFNLSRTLINAVLIQALAMYAIKISMSDIKILNEIFTLLFYENLRAEYIERGLCTAVKYPIITKSFTREVQAICNLCQKQPECNIRKIQISCQFQTKKQTVQEILDVFFFFKRFHQDPQDKTRYHPHMQLEALLQLLKPSFQKMQISQHLVFKILIKELRLNCEPSMYHYWLIKKHQSKLAPYYSELYNLFTTSLNSSTKWGIFYDYLFDEKLNLEV